MWMDYRTTPTGHLRLLDRPGHIVQRKHLTATAHLNWFSVSFDGPLHYCENGSIPDGFGVRWDVLLVEPTRDPR